MDYSVRLNELLDKHLQGISSKAETDEMIILLSRAEEEGLLIGRMKEIWQSIKAPDGDYPVNWDKMYERVTGVQHAVEIVEKQPVKIAVPRWRLAMAAIFILIAGASIYTFTMRDKPLSRPASAIVAGSGKQQQHKKNYRSLHLPDGSKVILYAGSNLDYPPVFAGKTREVTLTGQGYFDISHNPAQPFIVHTGKISTKVLGTAFEIRAYPQDESIEITVKRGKVQVLNEKKTLGLITANQMISFSKVTESFVQRTVDVKPYGISKTDEIQFDNITMREVASQIEERFLLDVEFLNSDINDCRVTATFSVDDSLDEMLTVICGVVKANYRIENDTVIIDGKGCAN